MAERSYPTSEVRVAAERSYPPSKAWRPGGETPCPRSDDFWLGEATSHPRPGAVTLRSHPETEARSGSWEEPYMPEARAGCWEEQPKEWWLRRHRRA